MILFLHTEKLGSIKRIRGIENIHQPLCFLTWPTIDLGKILSDLEHGI